MCQNRSSRKEKRWQHPWLFFCVAVTTLILLFFFSPIDHVVFNPPFSSSPSPSSSSFSPVSEFPLPPSMIPAPSYHLHPPQEKTKKSGDMIRVEKIEKSLAHARAAIQEATRSKNYTTSFDTKGVSFVPLERLYRNSYAFHRSHMEMMERFKVWAYKEGEPPLFHNGPTKSIYGIEGQFMDEMDGGMSKFMAHHPDEAHIFFLPISLLKVRQYILENYSRAPMHRVVLDYVQLLSQRYDYWNTSHGADHFLLSCHDWAPDVSQANPELLKHLTRALCNANTSEGFHPIRDISIPEINIPGIQLNPPSLRSKLTRNRKTLVFFAGGQHGYIRSLLFETWKEKDDEIQVHDHLPKGQDYFSLMGHSKFCLCPSGYEVASPRIVEAIHEECVPVLISSNYSLPFEDVLDWSQFSVSIRVEEIKDLKRILKGISDRKYLRLVKGVRSVKWHFTLNRPSKPFDMLHMVLHSVWLRRLNIKLPFL